MAAFAETLRVAGVDLDPGMLARAAARCPGTRLVAGDMTELDLGERFDVVTCLFGSIAYLRTVPRLRRAVGAMARHLEPAGVLVVEPWYEQETWDSEEDLDLLVLDEPYRKAARICRSSRRGELAAMDFDYVVADGGGNRHFTERHELRLFRRQQYLEVFAAAGLEPTVHDYGLWGHGLILGLAPP